MVCLVFMAGVTHAKSGRTYYDDEMMGRVADKIARYDWAKRQVEGSKAACGRWLAMSDDELWDFVPPPEQLRALNVSFGNGCPIHGKEVFRKGGHYPWIMSSDRPFKVKCPVGGEEYPGNDFEPWNLNALTDKPETGPGYVDHGAGWVDDKGIRYFFVGTYVFWHRWQREVLPAVSALANAYLLSGEPVFAHKCAVLLASIAEKYERYDYRVQAYHNGRWPAHINGRILDYIWSTGVTGSMAMAYDAIYPALDTTPDLLTFLKGRQIDDPRRFIETKMLNVMAEDIMRGFVVGNQGMHQQALSVVAIVLDNDDAEKGPTTGQMRDWIMTGPGTTEYLLWNGFYRDGHGGESSPGYSSGWCSNFYSVARLLPKLGVEIWDNPKVKKLADIGLDMAIAGEWTPCIGDSGNIFGSRYVGWSPQVLGAAFTHYKDPRYAQALTLRKASSESLFEDYFDEDEVAQVVAKVGTDMEFSTRNLGGYGLAILEAGQGEKRRGVSMYYGFAGGGHGHYDRLTMEIIAHDRPMLTDMGYPAHWLPKNTYWTSNTISHYCVVVDQHRQETTERGYLNTLAGSPQVQLMDASAERGTYPTTCSLYRRTAALIDVSPESSYLLDIFRVRGGFQHDYSFHGPPFPEFTVTGAEPGPVQAKGTLMGDDVEFGGTPSTQFSLGSSGGLVLPLRKAEGVLEDSRPYAERSLEGWAGYSGSSVLTRKEGAVLKAKFPEVPAGKVKLFVQVHNYGGGVCAVDVSLGGAATQLKWGPEGAGSAEWVSQVLELTSPAQEISIAATEVGQAYALILNAVLSSDLEATQPRMVDMLTSGFQYLFNVRRMRPEGTWSATWRNSEDDLALTMTMPAGCAQEVILADAEAELKPGHPNTLQYVLGRNVLEDAQAEEEGLHSAFISVSEPHKGPATIKDVSRLQAVKAGEEAVGLAVTHNDVRDLIHSSLDAADECLWQDGDRELAATGEFALASLDNAGVSRACLVNGTALRCGDFELHADPSPSGKVLSVDHHRNAITVDSEIELPQALVGRVVILGNELQQTSYTIKKATAVGGHTTLDFGDVLFLIQMGYVEEVNKDNSTVRLAKLDRVDGRRHEGRWLYNEDRSRGFCIARCSGDTFALEGVEGDLDAIFADADGDGRRLYWISDIGPGDTYRIPALTYVERVGPHLYRVQAMTSVTLTIPRAEIVTRP